MLYKRGKVKFKLVRSDITSYEGSQIKKKMKKKNSKKIEKKLKKTTTKKNKKTLQKKNPK